MAIHLSMSHYIRVAFNMRKYKEIYKHGFVIH